VVAFLRASWLAKSSCNSISAQVSSSGNDLQNSVLLTYSISTCYYPILSYKIYQDGSLIYTETAVASVGMLSYAVTDLNYGQSPSDGFQMPSAGMPEVGFRPEQAGINPVSGMREPSSFNEIYQMPSVATERPVPIGLQRSGADALAESIRPDVSKAGTPDKPFLSNEQMVRLGLSGGLGVYGAMQNKKAAEQNRQASGEQKALAAPYQQQGKDLMGAAQRGELTAAGQQQLQGLQAQLAQGAESRGGVGAAQAAAQAQAFRNQLLQNQYDYGLKVSQIGDNIALGAIRTGMQLDQQLNQANLAFYTQLGNMAAGVPTYQTVRSS
jgi:hypothetical protein